MQKGWLFFGARTREDAIYYEEFTRLAETMPNFRVVYALSETAPEDWSGEVGFIHEAAAKYLNATGNRQAFLCGPPLMIQAMQKVLNEKNIPEDKIFYDEF